MVHISQAHNEINVSKLATGDGYEQECKVSKQKNWQNGVKLFFTLIKYFYYFKE